jgi:hypothetical protein
MTRYANGRAPLSDLVAFDSGGGQHWGPAATRARWYRARRRIYERTGIWLNITGGWNVFRPLHEQTLGRQKACAQGNCNAAAVAGYSSHGLTWNHRIHTGGRWVDAAALDIGDYWRVPFAIFREEMEAAGFVVGGILRDVAGVDEWWHVIDLHPFSAIPAYDTARPFEPASKPTTGGIPMFALIGVPDQGLIYVQGLDGRRQGVQSAAHLEALLRYRNAMLTPGQNIEQFYFGDLVGARGAIDWYLGQVNGSNDADTLARLEQLRTEVAAIDTEFDGTPHQFTDEELAKIGAAAGTAAGAHIDAGIDDIVASIRTMPDDVVAAIKAAL